MNQTYLITKEKSQCTGCGACFQACPVQAIEMKYDEEEFIYPQIDENKCIDCGKCIKVCPYNKEPLFHKEEQQCYGGYVLDSNVLEESTSGGAFTAIVNAWCKEDFVIFGAAQNENLEVNHIAIECLEDLHLLRKSKYRQSNIDNAYRLCKEKLDEGKRVLFSGTPCQIEGLRKYLSEKDYENLLTVDVICEGVPTPKYIKKFVSYMEEKYNNKLQLLDYRDKDKNRWDFNIMSLCFKNGKKVKIDRWVNPFFDIWMQHVMTRPSCYHCRYTTSKRVSDITLGDLWGVHIMHPDLYNDDKGCSLIICNTDKANRIIGELKETMFLKKINLQEVIKYSNRMRNPIEQNERRSEFFADIDRMSYKQIKKKWYRRPSIHLLISKYIYGTNRQVVNRKLKNLK